MAKIVRESVYFERGLDPREAMGISGIYDIWREDNLNKTILTISSTVRPYLYADSNYTTGRINKDGERVFAKPYNYIVEFKYTKNDLGHDVLYIDGDSKKFLDPEGNELKMTPTGNITDIVYNVDKIEYDPPENFHHFIDHFRKDKNRTFDNLMRDWLGEDFKKLLKDIWQIGNYRIMNIKYY